MSSQALLDLEWVLTSPSLVSDALAAGTVDFEPATVDVDHLEAFLADRSEHRVGRYFEHLIHYWLAHVRKVDVAEVGMQIIDEKRRTIGEIDFLFRDEHGQLTHCEAAVKFFLHHPNDESSHFPGPAARDNFEKKSTRLFDTQLHLSSEHVPDVTTRLGFVRGRIFQQLGRDLPEVLPPRMASDCLGGVWVRESNIDTLDSLGDFGFHFVPKPHWFAPVATAQILTKTEFVESISSHFSGPAYPMMVSLRDSAGAEAHRCFVVPDVWPAEMPQLGKARS